MADTIILPGLGFARGSSEPDNTYVWWYDESVTSPRLQDKVKLFDVSAQSWVALSTINSNGGVGATSFLQLTDTFTSYAGRIGQGVVVNAQGTGLTTIPLTGTGTVTSVSGVDTNGFAFSIANASTIPAITLSTTVTGILKGNGTAMSAAVAGTDYQAPITLTTTGSSGAATFIGNTLNIPVYTTATPTLAQVLTAGNLVPNGTTINSANGNITQDYGSGNYWQLTHQLSGNNIYLDSSIAVLDAGTTYLRSTETVFGLATSKTGKLTLLNSTNSFGISLKSGVTANDITYVLPTVNPTAGQVLTASAVSGGGSDLSWTTISPGTGTVTGISIASANGFTGSSDGNPATPTLTIATSITGILKGNGTAMSAAVAGTDYVAPNGSITGATKTKITYDSKGLVTSGTDATTADINDSTNRRYVTDAQSSLIASATTVGSNLFSLANPSAVTFIRINADNSVSTRTASQFRSDIGAGTGDGTVTSVAWTTSQGVSASIANASTTPNITVTLGALTGVTSLNGLVVTANTGVVTTGTWNGSVITPVYGGTGVANNAASTITISGNFGTTFTVTNTTAVTLPTSGTLYGTATGSITSAQLLGSLSDETGNGLAVFNNTPTLITPNIGVASATSLAITGTSGAGFLDLISQASAPAANNGSLRVYYDATNGLSWTKRNIANNADITRALIMPDSSVAYTFPSATSTLLAHNLGIVGGTKVIGGTGVGEKISVQGTSANGTATAVAVEILVGNAGATVAATFYNNRNANIGGQTFLGGTGVATPTAFADISAGTTTVAPMRIRSGALKTSNDLAGDVQFLTDKAYLTITTGTAVKEFTLNDIALTSGRVSFNTTNGRQTDDANLTYNGTTFSTNGLTVTSGVAANGGGVKHKRITTGSISGGSTALVTLTWDTAFANANYTPQVSLVDSTTSSLSLSIVHIDSYDASTVNVRVLNNAVGSLTGTLLVTAIHD